MLHHHDQEETTNLHESTRIFTNLSVCGADAHQTPHIDALAASGTRFSTCYAAPLCGPTAR
jgi:arylsulfatase A-like enzyme